MKTLIIDFRKLSFIIRKIQWCASFSVLLKKNTLKLNEQKVNTAIRNIQKNFLHTLTAAFKKYHYRKDRFFNSKSNQSFLSSNITIKFEENPDLKENSICCVALFLLNWRMTMKMIRKCGLIIFLLRLCTADLSVFNLQRKRRR